MGKVYILGPFLDPFWTHFGPQNWTIWEPYWDQILAPFDAGRRGNGLNYPAQIWPKSDPKLDPKLDPKMTQKQVILEVRLLTPFWTPGFGPQKGLKLVQIEWIWTHPDRVWTP